jgi:hypothetical protein
MNFKSQFIDFAVLMLLLLTGLVGFLSFSHRPEWQVLISGLTGAGYVGWGVWHHLRWGNFYWQVVLEYALFAVLVLVMTWSILSL